MMKKRNCNGSVNRGIGGIIKKVMLIQFALALCIFTSVASVVSQNREVNLTFEDVSLSSALKGLSEASGCKFIFNYDDLNRYKVTAKLQGTNVEESLNILLKDAAATSLYGVRASNGVIVIVTKKAKDKTTDVNVSAGFYIYPLPSLSYQDYASSGDVIDFEREFLLNDPTYKSNPADYFSNKNDPASPGRLTGVEQLYYELSLGNLTEAQLNQKLDELRKYDYRKERQKALLETAVTQDYNLSIARGGENSNLFVSFRYQDYGQYVKSTESKRFSVYLKSEMDLAKWFKLTYGANAYFSRTKQSVSVDDLDVDRLNEIMPYERLKDDDGNLVYHYFHNY